MKRILSRTLILLGCLLLAVVIVLPIGLPLAVERIGSARLAEWGIPADVSLSVGYCWRNGLGIRSELRVAVRDSPWRLNARLAASLCEWEASVDVPDTSFSEAEPLLRRLLERYPVQAVSNLVFSGRVSLTAHAERTFGKPVPVWSVKAPLRNLSARFETKGGQIAIDGLSVTAGASGIADHLDIAPMFLRVGSIAGYGFALTNLQASVRATEKALMINEASVGCCGGVVSLYSVFLDPRLLNTGFTLFLDEIETCDLITHLRGFKGDATGRLHGKMRMFVREGGKSVRLGECFLYSTPGETGNLKVHDAEDVAANLSIAGLDEATRKNVANALTDLDYTALRFDLRRGEGKAATLGMCIKGTATRGDVTVPVDIRLNLNGELEQLVNLGLQVPNTLKGEQR